MPITFDRSICCDLNETISREWLVTNGLGGYAAGTVAGTLTRMQHGLLVASLPDMIAPQLLLAKLDEEVVFDQRTYDLGTNEYRDGTLNPSGFVHLETFRLEEGFPVFTYHLGGIEGIELEKRIWMPRGQNTTCIQYRVLRTAPNSALAYGNAGNGNNTDSGSKDRASLNMSGRNHAEAAQQNLTLTLLPFSAYRSHSQPQHGNNDWHFQVKSLQTEDDTLESNQASLPPLPKGIAGCTIRAWDGAHPYHILAVGHPEGQITFLPTGVWYWNFLRRHDKAAGHPAIDDLYLPGVIRAKLWPGEESTLTIVVTTEDLTSQILSANQLNLSYKQAMEYQRSLLQPQRYFGEGGETTQYLRVLPLSTESNPHGEGEEFLRLLLHAGDCFQARRVLPRNELSSGPLAFFNETNSIPLLVPSYYSMEDNTRDTLIALPGLTLATGRFEVAGRILRTFARYFKQGMLPDRLPKPGQPLEELDYGSVDTTLWYFYALDHYLRATQDYELLDDLYHRLTEAIRWYTQGTYNGIRMDSRDGLLQANQPGKALTWMNARVHNHPITPRQGKPVEVNALWFHALSLLHEWSHHLYHAGRIGHIPPEHQDQSTQCRESFQQRFWYAPGGYLYDVVDGPNGNDAAIRPNQLLALSLRHPILDEQHRQSVFEVVTQHLLTPYGLRTLAPQEAGYQAHLKTHRHDQQRALHQGSAWPWLLGPYTDAMLRILSSTIRTTSAQDTSLQQEYIWRKGLQLLEPFRKQLNEGFLGMIGNVFDGDAPHTPGNKTASAISLGEILRTYHLLASISTRHHNHVLLA